MARAETEAVLWRDGDLIRQRAGIVAEDFQSAGVFAGGCVGSLPRVTTTTARFEGRTRT